MSEAKEAVLRLMNEYCYRIDAGDKAGFAALFKHGTFVLRGDPSGGDTGTDCIGTAVRHGCRSMVNFHL